jgi:hypothetical protein
LERSVRRGMPGVVCTTHIVAHRWSWSGERVVPSALASSLHKWPGGRSKTGHPADALTLGPPYSSARGRGQIPFPIGFAPGLPNYWPRCFPHRIWRGLYSVSRSYGAGDRQVLDMVARLVGVFGMALTQENGPRRRRGNKPRALPSLYRAFAPLCLGVRGLLRHGVLRSWPHSNMLVTPK